jgi:hypothetical protein
MPRKPIFRLHRAPYLSTCKRKTKNTKLVIYYKRIQTSLFLQPSGNTLHWPIYINTPRLPDMTAHIMYIKVYRQIPQRGEPLQAATLQNEPTETQLLLQLTLLPKLLIFHHHRRRRNGILIA